MVGFRPRVAATGLAARLQYFDVEGPDLEPLEPGNRRMTSSFASAAWLRRLAEAR